MTLLAMLFAAVLELHSDPNHTIATFSVKHLMVMSVRGQFGKAQSTLLWNQEDAAKSSVDFKIDATTVDTHVENRDKDLKSDHFFDAARCPEIAFKSTKITPAGADKFSVTGDLTMRCATKPVTLDVFFNTKGIKTPWGSTVYGASATGKLKRSEWGLVWNAPIEGGGVVVGEDVDLDVQVEYNPPPAKK
jgi:polyisoprenoid-binding protein YceI